MTTSWTSKTGTARPWKDPAANTGAVIEVNGFQHLNTPQAADTQALIDALTATLPTPAPTPTPTPTPSPVVAPGNPLDTGPSADGVWTSSFTVPSPGTIEGTANFGDWSWWGQGQGGPPYSATTNPADSYYGGDMGTATPASLGIPEPPTSQELVAQFTVTETSLTDKSLGSGMQGATSAKVYKYFEDASGNAPADVSGTYSAWFYVPSSVVLPGPASSGSWINFFQWKQTAAGNASSPLWWLQMSSASWLVDAPLPGSYWVGPEPAAGSSPTAPIIILNHWGNDWSRKSALMAAPLDKWFQVTAVLTQDQSIVFTIDGLPFDTAEASEAPVSPTSGNPYEFIFGVGNYANCPNTLYVGQVSYTPLPSA